MGSFNKIAFVSQLPIETGDETVLIFMSATEEFGKDLSGTTYPHDMFNPTFLPIYGTYDDYGRIENIKESPIVSYIEEFFDSDITTIINDIDDNAVGRGDTITAKKNNDVFKKLTFGLEHKSVYDKMSSEFNSVQSIQKQLQYSENGLRLNGTRFRDNSFDKYLATSKGLPFEDPIDIFINRIGEKEIIDFLNFNSCVSSLDSKYFPSSYGSQSQDHALHYKMLTLYRNIIVKKIGEYDEHEHILKELQQEVRDEKLIDILK